MGLEACARAIKLYCFSAERKFLRGRENWLHKHVVVYYQNTTNRMSVVSSVPSNRSSSLSWRLNDRLGTLMDSIYAIGAGLGLRWVVDTVTRHNFKITGTLVGLWEGVILLHFMKKMPRSTDPFVAFGVRLFVDFIITESVTRFVLVIIWTGMGMVLADITPAIWEDTGLRRTWRHLRRDLYTISEKIPTVVFYPPTRIVRFSPSREPSVFEASEVEAEVQNEPSDTSSSVGITEQPTLTDIAPPVSYSDHLIRRRLPGYFPGAFSDTDSVLSSVVGHARFPSTLPHDHTRTSRRLSVYPTRDFSLNSDSLSQNDDVDDANVSSSNASESTETPGASVTPLNADISTITEIPDEEEPLVLSTQIPKPKVSTMEKEELTLISKRPFPLIFPPTPSDSQAPHKRLLLEDDSLRRSGSIPHIPDLPEDAVSEYKEKVDIEDTEQPPSPPEKDWVPESLTQEEQTASTSNSSLSTEKDSVRKLTTQEEKIASTINSPLSALGGQRDMTEFLQRPTDQSNSNPIVDETTNAHEHRQSLPPPYSTVGANDDVNDSYVPVDTNATFSDPSAGTAGVDEVTESREAEAEGEEVKENEVEEREVKEEAEKEERDQADEALVRENKRAKDGFGKPHKLAEVKNAEEGTAEEAAKKVVARKEEVTRGEREEEAIQRNLEEASQVKPVEEVTQSNPAEASLRKLVDEEAVKRKQEDSSLRKLEEEISNTKPTEEAVQRQPERERREVGADMTYQHSDCLGKAVENTATEEDAENMVARGTEDHQRAQVNDAAPSTTNPATTLGQHDEDSQRTPTTLDTKLPMSDSDTTYPRQDDQNKVSDVGLHEGEEHVGERVIETESVTSELSVQSEVPRAVKDRVERVLMLKAQIVDLRKQIEELEEKMKAADKDRKSEVEEDLQTRQKILRKMKKKEQKRWDACSFCNSSQPSLC